MDIRVVRVGYGSSVGYHVGGVVGRKSRVGQPAVYWAYNAEYGAWCVFVVAAGVEQGCG